MVKYFQTLLAAILILQFSFGGSFVFAQAAKTAKSAASQASAVSPAASTASAAETDNKEGGPAPKKSGDGFGDLPAKDPWSNDDGCADFWNGGSNDKVCVPSNSGVGGTNGSGESGDKVWGGWDPSANGATGGNNSSGSGDIWGNGGVSGDGGWGGGNNSGGWSNDNGFMSGYNVTPSWIINIINITGVLQEDYYKYVANLRKKYSYQKSDEALADEVIENGISEAKVGAYANAATTFALTQLIPTIEKKYGGGGVLGGMGVGFVSYMGFDYFHSVVPRARMILRLAALNGNLPFTLTERAALIDSMVIFDILVNSGSAVSQIFLENYIAKILNLQAADKVLTVARNAMISFGAGTAGAASQQAAITVAEQLAASQLARDQVAANIIRSAADAGVEIPKKSWLMELISKFPGLKYVAAHFENEAKLVISGLIAGAIVGGISIYASKWITQRLGDSTKLKLKAQRQLDIASAKAAIEASPNYEKQVLWLLVLKSAFSTYPLDADEEAKRALDKERASFLFALAAKYPLVKTRIIDEKANILSEYERDLKARKSNPKAVPLIDAALIKIASHQPVSVRFQIFKTVMYAMYVGKQTLTNEDQKALETISIELGINLPTNVLEKIPAHDYRREIVSSFDSLKSQIANRHAKLNAALRGHSKLVEKDTLENLKTWRAGTTLLLEDLTEGSVFEQAKNTSKKSGLTQETFQENKRAASAAAAKIIKSAASSASAPR